MFSKCYRHTFGKAYFLCSNILWIRDSCIVGNHGNRTTKKKNTYTHARVLHYTRLLTVTYSSGKPYLTVSFLIMTDSWYWMDVYTEDFVFYVLLRFLNTFSYSAWRMAEKWEITFPSISFIFCYTGTYIYN